MSGKRSYKVIFCLCILFAVVLVLFKPLGSGDELWNYNFARNIAQGNVPYRDFSIIQTPLSAYVSGFFLWIFGNEMLIFRILTCILFGGIFYLFFEVSRKLTGNNMLSVCITAVVMYSHIIFFIYNYNYVTVFILLLIFYLEGKEKNRGSSDLIIGFLVGITILVKQNTGFLIWIANIIICLRGLKAGSKKTFSLRIVASLIPSLIYFIYLYLTNTFYDFFDYAILGISTFTHRFSLLDFCKTGSVFVLSLIAIIIMYILIVIKMLRKKASDYQFAVFMFSLAWTSVMYPLADASHVCLVLFTVTLSFISFYKLEKNEDIVKLAAVFLVVFWSVVIFHIILEAGFHIAKVENYRGMIVEEKYEKLVLSVDRYIREKEKAGYKVRIADASAALFQIPLDNYEKNWDMLLVGNLGSNTISDLLQSDKPVSYLVKRSGYYDMQDHKELITYIKMNYRKTGEIGVFDVYEEE